MLWIVWTCLFYCYVFYCVLDKVQTKWPREKVLKLISLHVKYEEMLLKPSTKKVSGDKADQKWKNLTKTFRDTVDLNKKSGNEPKKCPYYDKLQEAYGYRPNVTPAWLDVKHLPVAVLHNMI